MEHNAYEAIKTNLFGTKYLAELSIEHNIKKFVFISTDKAVNPISTMGLTKAIGEKYLKSLNAKSETFFIATRFGNIIGSNGSLLPLLKKQIESGGPITVTDKETSRYFIDKQSACHLILEISTIQKSKHHLFTFKMGNPVRIIDIVDRLLLNYSYSSEHIEIKYIGLRPGEKLYEQMISEAEIVMPLENKKISIIVSKKNNIIKDLDFSELKSITPYKSDSEIKSILQDLYKNL
jgi:FlaA1/EpsC-like NDP-sugar epimerase